MPENYIGTMCGTSLDTLDVALCNFGKANKVRLFRSFRLGQPLRDQINLCKQKPSNKRLLENTDEMVTEFIINSLSKFITLNKIKNIKAIGYPGITVVHKPKQKTSVTLGDPRKITKRLAMKVIADFRMTDMQAGGQGAPLAPYFHDYISLKQKSFINIINLGGFANLTYKSNHKLMAFDTGPANYLIDMVSRKYFKQPYDKCGLLAKKGKVNVCALKAMLADKYFEQAPPKSTGFEKFNIKWLDKFIRKYKISDETSLIATITELTSISVSDAINTSNIDSPYIFFSGGGSKNTHIRRDILKRTGMTEIKNLPWGLNYKNLESCAFAWLAMKRDKSDMILKGYVTGAKKNRRLGTIYR
mgnify:CR=1 FL=1